MQNKITGIIMLMAILFTATSCELVGDIFQAGMGFGIFIIIVIIAIIAFVIAKLGGNK